MHRRIYTGLLRDALSVQLPVLMILSVLERRHFLEGEWKSSCLVVQNMVAGGTGSVVLVARCWLTGTALAVCPPEYLSGL